VINNSLGVETIKISRTPFRVSLFGGSTDYPSFYNQYGSLLVGFALNKYCHLCMSETNKTANYHTKFVYSKIETVDDNEDIQHGPCREAMRRFNFTDGVDLVHMSDLPKQTGIGSSSSFLVGLIKLISRQINMDLPVKTHYEATHIERKILKEPGGIQDAIWADYGGFNSIEIDTRGVASVRPLPISPKFVNKFLRHSCLVYVGDRDSFDIAASHTNETAKHAIKNTAIDGLRAFYNEDLVKVGKLLKKSWQAKRDLSDKVSNSEIDLLMDELYDAGMRGGKLLGSGGSGFIFGIFDDVEYIKDNFTVVSTGIDWEGSKVIYDG
jgi:D-glycero-alpha-D-manno-heptose-7-phosphate kinase